MESYEGKFTWHQGSQKFMIKPFDGSSDILLLGDEPISIKYKEDNKYFDFDKTKITYPEKNYLDSERNFSILFKKASSNEFHAKLGW